MKNIFSRILVLLVLVALSSSHVLADNIIIQSSTSLKNSGFYRFLAPILKQHTDVEIRVVAVGTGQAIKNMKNCDGDVLITHAKEAELEFLKTGYGLERFEFMYNHWVIIGPEKAKKEINSENFSYQIVDITDFKIVKKSIDELEEKLGQIDIFVNNAGMTGMNAKVWDYPLDEWQKVIELNLNSTFYCCKAIVPYMIKNNYGRIVNIASIAGKDGNPNASAYSTSKAGVIGLTKSLGKELADKNIAVNCVTPAAAKTRIFDQMTDEHINYMLSKIPRNRFAKIEELASLVCWLVSDENSFSTAGVFDLSGGRATY